MNERLAPVFPDVGVRSCDILAKVDIELVIWYAIQARLEPLYEAELANTTVKSDFSESLVDGHIEPTLQLSSKEQF